MKKYIRRSNNIDSDFAFYLGKESLYGHFFGHIRDAKRKSKVNYIWNALLHQFYTKDGQRINH